MNFAMDPWLPTSMGPRRSSTKGMFHLLHWIVAGRYRYRKRPTIVRTGLPCGSLLCPFWWSRTGRPRSHDYLPGSCVREVYFLSGHPQTLLDMRIERGRPIYKRSFLNKTGDTPWRCAAGYVRTAPNLAACCAPWHDVRRPCAM